ncbi:MAG: sigma-70 family RNA polymerase sigma factor [Lachnospiraceae bacterium]|nr:sigma-70 family RNA polymerase sigma factor [Lachnospiraceae bacterium]
MNEKSLRADDYEMIEKYSNMVYRMAYSMVKTKEDAEDIHQDVFMKYLKKRPEFENEEHAKAWFLRVTVNHCKNFWKSAWMQRMIGLEEGGSFAEKEEVHDELIDTVKRLPQKYRAVIHLFYYEDLSIEEMSEVLGEKPSTVRTQLTRARGKLKEMLEEEGNV